MKFEDARPGMIVRKINPLKDSKPEMHAVAYLREQKMLETFPGIVEPAWFGFWITPKVGGVNWPNRAAWDTWEPVDLT